MAAHFFRTNERVFNFSHSLGRREYKGLRFRSPVDLTLGKDGLDPAQPKGLMYVISRADEHSARTLGGVRVVMLTMQEEYVGDFGHFGDGDGGFRWPTALDLDREGNVYVSNEWLQRLSIFDREGKFLTRWDLSPSNGGEPVRPCGITFDRNDNLYVVDRSNHRVQVYTKEGRFLHQFGCQGGGPGRFNMPWGITIDDKDNVWVADWRNDHIQKLTLEGAFLASLGCSGDLPGQFSRPTDIAVDGEGDVYVTDWLNHRVQVFTPELRYITSFLGDATISPWAWDKIKSDVPNLKMLGTVRDLRPMQRFRYPAAVEVDRQGRVVVVERVEPTLP